MQKALHRDTAQCQKKCKELKKKYLTNRNRKRRIPQKHYQELEFWYRMLLRTFCSEIEGLCYVMRSIVSWAEDRGDITLTPAEGTLIREQEYYYNSRRKRIETRTGRFNRTLDNILISLQLFPRVFKSDFQTDFSKHGYQHFQHAIELRNIVTHPKEPGDLHKLTEIIPALSEGAAWFYDCMGELFASIDPAVIEEAVPAQQEELKKEPAREVTEKYITSMKEQTQRLRAETKHLISELRASKSGSDSDF